MAKYSSEQLLDNLAADVRQILFHTEQLHAFTDHQLRRKPHDKAWSVVEVIAHLNFYARFYNTAIEAQLNGHRTHPQADFQPGILGNYFTRVIGPAPTTDGRLPMKMKSPQNAQPQAASTLQPETEIRELIQHQHHILNLLKIARSADLGRIRVPISLSRFIRLKLGDTFRFLIAHEQRHFQQIDRVLAGLEVEETAS